MAAFTENEMKDFKITDWYDLSGQVAVVTGGGTCHYQVPCKRRGQGVRCEL